MPTFGSLFSGIGGLDLGLERAGWECRWQVEIDPFCRAVLEKHWPDVPRFGDVRELAGDELEPVDLIAGGFPCQPVSHAGRRRGTEDDRWLWPEFARTIRLLRPRLVFVENVPGLLAPYEYPKKSGKWWPAPVEEVFGDLVTLGYDAEWDSIPAAAVGAPHLRYRVWIVAHREGDPSRPNPDGQRPHRETIDEHGRTEQGGAGLRDEQEREPRSVGPPLRDAELVRASGPVPDTEREQLRVERERDGEQHQEPRSAIARVDGSPGTLADTDRVEDRGLHPGRQNWQSEAEPARRGADVADTNREAGRSAGAAGQEVLRSGPLERSGRRSSSSATGDVADADLSGDRAEVFGEEAGRTLPIRSPGGPGGSGWWAVEPNVGRVAHGVPSRVDRLRALGNAVVPQVAEWIGRRILMAEAGNGGSTNEGS